MSDVSDVQIPKAKRKVGCLSQLIVAVVLLVFIGLVAAFAWNSFASRRFDTAISSMRNSGYATSPAELEATYGAIAEPNPGPLWVEAGKNFMADQAADTKKLPFIGSGGDEIAPGQSFPEISNARKFLARHERDLELVRRAAKNPNPARYPGPLVSPPDQLIDNTSYIQGHRQICRVLGIQGLVQAYDKDIDGLAMTLEQNLRVGPSLMNEPTIMCQLVGSACVQMALADIEKFLGQDFTDEQLASSQNSLRKIDVFKSLRRGLEGEAVRGISAFQDPKTRGGVLPRHDDSAFLVEQLFLLIEASESKDWNEVNRAVRKLDELVEETGNGPTGLARYGLSTHMLPGYGRLCDSELRLAAELRVHDALIATRRFQIKHGRLPEELEQLVPEFLPLPPIDPCSSNGERLIFKIEEGNVLIYSRGINGEDDGGDEEISKQGLGKLDIAAELQAN